MLEHHTLIGLYNTLNTQYAWPQRGLKTATVICLYITVACKLKDEYKVNGTQN